MNNRVFTSKIKTVYVAGDLHGDYNSLTDILDRYNEAEKGSLLLFLGDYADRGSWGVEIITELNAILSERNDIIALKGNHELYRDGRPVFYPCDLIYEAQQKYSSWEKFYNEVFIDFLGKLYIAAVINKVLFVHGGVSSKIKSIDDLRKQSNETTILWSDPSQVPGENPDIRGVGVEFGEDVTDRVLSSLDLRMMVRSHEPRKAARGPYVEHGGRVITTNACTSYGEPWKPFLLKVDTKQVKYEAVYL